MSQNSAMEDLCDDFCEGNLLGEVFFSLKRKIREGV